MLAHFGYVGANAFKAFFADHMLYAAGVLKCSLSRYAEEDEPVGEQAVALRAWFDSFKKYADNIQKGALQNATRP